MVKHKLLQSFLLSINFLLLYILLRAHTFWGELVHDDGLFLLGAQAWAKGLLPYHDFWDHKPPCVFLYNALPLFFFPFSLWAVKLFHCIVLTVSAMFLFHFLRRYVSASASFIACLFYIYFTSQRYTIQSGGLTEEGALVFVIASYWIVQKTDWNHWRQSLVAGLCLGIAVQFRQTFAAEAAMAVGLLWMNQSSIKATIHHICYFVIGMILPEVLFSFYFLVNGAWWDYVEASYLYNFYYIGPARPDTNWSSILLRQYEMIRHTGFFLLSPITAVSLLYWMKWQHRWLSLLLQPTLLGDGIAIALSGEFYAHYYVQSAVTCGIYFALTLDTLINIWKNNFLYHFSIAKMISILIVLFCIYLSFYTGKHCYRDYMQSWKETHQPISEYTFQHDVARVIEQITLPEDRILLIGRIPNSVYFLSKRLAGSRFYHYSPIWKPSLQGAVTERQKKAFMDDLIKNQPVLLLMDLTRLENGDGLQRVEENVPEALPYIQEQYTRLEEKYPNVETLWDWYNIRLQLLVRNDRLDVVTGRILEP